MIIQDLESMLSNCMFLSMLDQKYLSAKRAIAHLSYVHSRLRQSSDNQALYI